MGPRIECASRTATVTRSARVGVLSLAVGLLVPLMACGGGAPVSTPTALQDAFDTNPALSTDGDAPKSSNASPNSTPGAGDNVTSNGDASDGAPDGLNPPNDVPSVGGDPSGDNLDGNNPTPDNAGLGDPAADNSPSDPSGGDSTDPVVEASDPVVPVLQTAQVVLPGTAFFLDASNSIAPDGAIFAWTQWAGTNVKLDNQNTSIARGVAPSSGAFPQQLGFRVSIRPPGGSDYRADVVITVTDDAPEIDADADGLPDAWEIEQFGSLARTATEDIDNDDLTNLEELAAGTHPTLYDTDGDLMHDAWEYYNATDPLTPSADEDLDFDGVTNLEEYMAGLNPMDADSDDDGLTDDDAGVVEPDLAVSAPYTLTVTSDGGMLLTASGYTTAINSFFYHRRDGDDPNNPRNHFGWPIINNAEDGWSPTIVDNGVTATVSACGAEYCVDRQITRSSGKITVRDTITNLTNADVAIPHYTQFVNDGTREAGARWVSGYPLGGYDSANPTTFMELETGGLGVLVGDDISRVQTNIVRSPTNVNVHGIYNDRFGLGALDSVELEWVMYPIDSTSYWDFINQVRRDRTRNYPIQSHLFLGNPNPDQWITISDAERTSLFQQLAVGKVTMQPWSRLDGPKAFGADIFNNIKQTSIDNIENNLIDKVDATGLGITQLLYWDSFLTSEDNAHTLYADSLIRDGNGNPRTRTDGLTPLIPTLTNSWGAVAMQAQTEIVETYTGVDGLYFDTSTHPSILWTEDPAQWDGYSFENDRVNGVPIRRRGNVTLLSRDFRVEQVQRLYDAGYTAMANYAPITNGFADLQMLHIVEIGQLRYQSTAARTHLTTPMVLNIDYPLNDLTYFVGSLYHGALHTPTTYVEPFTYASDIYAQIFPIEPAELHNGTIIGADRIVTCKTGFFGFGDASTLTVHAYGFDGLPITPNATQVSIGGKTYIQVLENSGMMVITR